MLQSKYKFFSLLMLILVLACDKEENPDPVLDILFNCYDPVIFGPLRPDQYNGLPTSCIKDILIEPFNENINEWPLKSEINWIDYKIENGQYEIITQSMYTYNLNNFNNFTFSDSEYQIEVKLNITQTIKNSRAVGITFNGINWKYNYFGITNDDKVVYGENKSREMDNILLDSQTYLNDKDYKSIMVRNFNDTTYMFLDGVLKFKKYLPFIGNELGYIIPQNSNVSIDEIQIKSLKGFQ